MIDVVEFNLDIFLDELNSKDDFQESEDNFVFEEDLETRHDLSQSSQLSILEHINIFSSVDESIKIENIHQRTLSAICSLKGILHVSLHKVTDDFDIILRSVKPLEMQEDAEKLFKSILDMGKIGKMLNTGRPVNIDRNHELGFVTSAFPLLYGDSCWGILLVAFEEDCHTNNYIQAFSIFAGYLGPNLKIIDLNKQNEKMQSDQMQIVSEKTNELRNSQRQLNAIINTVQAGIILADKKTEEILSINQFAENFTGHHLSDMIDKALTLGDLFDNYSVSFGAIKGKIKTIGGRNIEVMRNTEITKLSDKDIIVETFLDISFVKELREEFKIKLKTNENKYLSQINKLKDANLELNASLNNSRISSLNTGSVLSIANYDDIIQQLQYDIRQPLSNIVLMTENLISISSNQKKAKEFTESIGRSYDLITSNLDDMSNSQQSQSIGSNYIPEAFTQIAQLHYPILQVSFDLDIAGKIQINTYTLRKLITNIVKFFSIIEVENAAFVSSIDSKGKKLHILITYHSEPSSGERGESSKNQKKNKKQINEQSHLWSALNSVRIMGGVFRLVGYEESNKEKKIEIELPYKIEST